MEKNNMLTLIGEPWKEVGPKGGKSAIKYANFKCDCGNIKKIGYSKWKSGWTKSCGCILKESCHRGIAKKRQSGFVHDLADHPLYYKWCHIKENCNTPSHKGYLGGNIKMFSEWENNFKAFYDWCLENGWKRGIFLNRKDLNQDFCPDNCYFSEKRLYRNNHEKQKETMIAKYGFFSYNMRNGSEEKSVRDWIESEFNIKTTVDHNILNKKEIDIYYEQGKIGIEYCGIHWHCEKRSGTRRSHIDKYNLAKSKGVHLIHIFSDEWFKREKQIKNFLKSIFGRTNNRVFARKCEVKEIEKKIANDFLERTHIQGASKRSQFAFGIFLESQLLGVMTFAKHHRKINNGEIVLDRMSFEDDYSVVGGASKLLKFSAKKLLDAGFTKIISWSDNRWSTGNVYEKMGFTLEKELGPDYSYVYKSGNKRVSKQSMKKSKTGCPKDKTEKQWCKENGYYRIWDCGKKRFVLELTKSDS